MSERKDPRRIGERSLSPQSLMMSYGYEPALSEGALKCPIFQTSTFVFNSAEEGKAFFEVAYGLRAQEAGESLGLIYSRLNNPDLEILEDRLTLWDGAEASAVFESGMAAIATTAFTLLRPGDRLLFSEPVYGGTQHLFRQILPEFGIETRSFVSFDVRGGQEAAFRVLNALQLIRLAVSLGGTESLAQHPATMTHADVPPESQRAMGITESMIRLSVGVEEPGDLIADLESALRF